jgi:curved DNA-binding protein CbpA
MSISTLIALAVFAADTLYDRLGLARSADHRAIRKAWHLLALKEHPDKVNGDAAEKEAAAERFKRAAEAYEVLSDAALRERYDATGEIPDDKAKAEASAKSTGGAAGEEDEYGFDGQQQHSRPHQRSYGWGGRFDQFEVNLAQSRARRVRTLEGLRKLLQPSDGARRFGLIGFYRSGDDAMLKRQLRFPYPFAGWSLAAQGDGFWWEDAIQTVLVSVGELGGSQAGGLLSHFGLSHDARLPAVAWVRRDEAMSFELTSRLSFDDDFVSWVYDRLGATVRVLNRDHRPATVWWLDGTSAKQQGVVPPGGSFERSSFLSHRWYCWPESTQGSLLTEDASLGEITLTRVGEVHELVLKPKCVDANGHCKQWRDQGECERNPSFMSDACPRSCRGPRSCKVWGWLYQAGLGPLHKELACWADASCALESQLPSGGHAMSDPSELRRLPQLAANWLRGVAAQMRDGALLQTVERLLSGAPPPVPLPTRKVPSPPPPLLPPRDEL